MLPPRRTRSPSSVRRSLSQRRQALFAGVDKPRLGARVRHPRLQPRDRSGGGQLARERPQLLSGEVAGAAQPAATRRQRPAPVRGVTAVCQILSYLAVSD